MQRGEIRWRRNLVISAILAVLILILQLVAGTALSISLISAALSFGVAIAVLAVSDRFSRR